MSAPPQAARPKGWLTRIVSVFMEPVFYWMGWLDPSGNPANSKIIYTGAAVAAIYLCVAMGLRMIAKVMEVTWPYVGLVALVLLFCAGVEVYKKTVAYLASLKLSGIKTTKSSQSLETSETTKDTP
jgi:hypothetical protein